ncbi:hypothetical protein HMPREF1207_05609 [Paenibacillus sp. HGH0039]|nr:hypothetical protein HMPREF1207_05609 [Paenibacillus sp. HGH0039]
MLKGEALVVTLSHLDVAPNNTSLQTQSWANKLLVEYIESRARLLEASKKDISAEDRTTINSMINELNESISYLGYKYCGLQNDSEIKHLKNQIQWNKHKRFPYGTNDRHADPYYTEDKIIDGLEKDGVAEDTEIVSIGRDMEHLSPRQKEIIEMKASGMTNSQIAATCKVAEGTVTKHTKMARDKTKALQAEGYQLSLVIE